jgi:hypothetical protein
MPTADISRPLTIEQAAARAGAWAWAEGRLYELVGAWAKAPGSARCKLYFDSASQHHAWRAQLWRDRLAGRLVQAHGEGLPQAPPGLLGPPSRPAEDAIEALAAMSGDAARLSAYCRVVLPRVASAYRAWSTGCSADRPVARALSMALADVICDWQEGSAILVEVLDSGADAAVAEAAEALARADGPFVSWGSW